MSKVALFLAVALAVCGCSKSSEADETAQVAKQSAQMNGPLAPTAAAASAKAVVMADGVSTPQATAAASVAPAVIADRRVIRHADLTVRVKGIEESEKSIRQVIQRVGGYLESASSTDLASDHPELTMTMRVPVAAFDSVIAQLESQGVRLSKTVSSEDVTGQVVDLDARLKSLSAKEETLRNILRGVRGLDNVLQLQDKLTEVRSEIESLTGQRKALAGQAELSTVTLHLQQDAVPATVSKDPNWFSQAWAEASSSGGAFGRAFVVMILWLAVFSPAWLALLWLIRYAIKASRRHPAAPFREGRLGGE